MQIIVCDHCRSDQVQASEIVVTVIRRIPASGPGKKFSTEQVTSPVAVELCGSCAERFGLSVGHLVQAVRDSRFDMPELPGEDETDDLTGQPQEAVQEQQESLPLTPQAPSDETIQEPKRGRKAATG